MLNKLIVVFYLVLALTGGALIGQNIERSRGQTEAQNAVAQAQRTADKEARDAHAKTIKSICTYALESKSLEAVGICTDAQESAQFEYMCNTYEVSSANCWVEDKK